MKTLCYLIVVLLGGLIGTLQAEDCSTQNAALQQQNQELQKELTAAKATIAMQKEKLQRIKTLTDEVGIIQKAAGDKDAEQQTVEISAAKAKAEADKKAAEATLQAELEADDKGKESAEAVAALKDFGVNTLGARMKKYWRLPPNIPENLSVKIFVKLDSSGNVVKASIKQSSGYKLFDEAALRAVHDASPLPMPKHLGAVEALVSDGIITKFDP